MYIIKFLINETPQDSLMLSFTGAIKNMLVRALLAANIISQVNFYYVVSVKPGETKLRIFCALNEVQPKRILLLQFVCGTLNKKLSNPN